MTRPCTCDRVHAAAYSLDQCRPCWLYRHRSDYRELWDRTGAAAEGRAGPCRHRGEAVDVAECPSCGGTVRLKVFACAVHARCTASRAVAGLACCASCPDFEAPA